MTEIGRITVVMYDSEFFDGKMQLSDYRQPSTKLGFWVGANIKTTRNAFEYLIVRHRNSDKTEPMYAK